jgi:hypothetical protein
MKKFAILVGMGLISTAAIAQEAPGYSGTYDVRVVASMTNSGSSTVGTTSAHAAGVGFEAGSVLSMGSYKSSIDAQNAMQNYGGR